MNTARAGSAYFPLRYDRVRLRACICRESPLTRDFAAWDFDAQ
jgi:hypothetical protein